jgi:integrase
MSYSDLIKFNWNECFIEDGDYYIRDIRFKTGVEYFLMILPPAMDIIKKFNNKLPVISNQQYNLRLKVVGQMCGIEKSLTTHVARHTFATTITLSNGVPISIVSKMLGHTKISTTEQYAKILNKNVKDQFLLLKEKIKRGK